MKLNKVTYYLFALSAAIIFLLSGIFITQMAQAEPAQLNFHPLNIRPKSQRFINCYLPWFASLEKTTNGAVKINCLPFDPKTGAKAGYEKVISGEVDISLITPAVLPDLFPLGQISSFNGIGLKDPAMASYVVWNTYKNISELQKEFDKFQVLFAHAYAPMVIASKSRPIRVPNDLSGLTTWAILPTKPIIEAAGSGYQMFHVFQIGAQLEAGKIDAAILGWNGLGSFGAFKTARYFTELPIFGGPSFFIIMNKEKWNALSTDVQQAIMDASGDKGSRLFGEGDGLDMIKAKEFINSQTDKELIVLTSEEEEQWDKLVAPFKEKMILQVEAKGIAAQKVFDEMVQLANQYRP